MDTAESIIIYTLMGVYVCIMEVDITIYAGGGIYRVMGVVSSLTYRCE